MHGSGGGEDLSIAYVPFSGPSLDTGEETLKASTTSCWSSSVRNVFEIQRGYPSWAPSGRFSVFHRRQGCQDIRQPRATAYSGTAHKLAEMELMRSETGNTPLCSWTMSCRSLIGRPKFLVEILNTKAQTIITTTHLGSFTEDILATRPSSG